MLADNLALSSPSTRLLTLPKRQQILLGVAAVVLLAGSLFLTHSLIPLGIIIAVIIGYAVIRNPVSSIFAFVVINVILALLRRETQTLAGDAPTIPDLIFGLLLAGIIGYWIVRLRWFESQPLSTSLGQILLILFAIWALFVTVVGLLLEKTPIFPALREILNLSPLLILPLLYERFITPDSKVERLLLACVLAGGIIVFVHDLFMARSKMLDAIYLFQAGKANSDETLSGLIVLITASMLMSIRRTKIVWIAVGLLLLASGAIVVSFSRGLYVATLVSLTVLLVLGTTREFQKGISRLFLTTLTVLLAMIPVYFTSRFVRLVVLRYGLRFVSTRNLKTDPSMLNRYSEYRHALLAILHSPILGYGFGSRIRSFQTIGQYHVWVAFVHNSYLFIAFKTGLPGALLFFAAYFLFLYKGFKLIRSGALSSGAQILVRGCVAYLILISVYSYIGPIMDSKTDMVWIGLIWGYFLALERYHGIKEKATSAHTHSPVLLQPIQ